VDGKIYVIGGAPFSGGFTAIVEEYNPATDTWAKRADMPTARQGIRAAAVDGIIYAIGGRGEANVEILSAAVEAYDPATDTWTSKADMPTARTQTGIAVVDGRIYVIGGISSHPQTVLSAVEAYDPATNTWTKKADMPTARSVLAACVVDGRIYVSGGATKHGGMAAGTWGSVPTVEVYDPATDTWTQASDMPWPRFGHTASVVAGKMYIISGAPDEMGVNHIEVSKTVDVYDPATDTWTTAADFPTARGNHTAAVLDGKIYTIGGNPMHGPFPLSTVYEFDPGLPDSISVTSPAGKLLRTWGEVKSE
jgi:N-acetylneuraminic acid mutarotase